MQFLKSLGFAAVAAASIALAALPAQAEWPDGPITMLIGYKAGGGTDTKGRVLAKQLGEELGVPVKVINRPGGGQATALLWFKEQPADGSIFFFGAITGLTLNPHLNPSLDFRYTDYDYCCTVTEFQPAMVAPASAPFEDWAGFIAYAKANPGVKYAALSPYARILMQLIAEKDGLDVNYIPTKGGAGMVQLILGNQDQAPAAVSRCADPGGPGLPRRRRCADRHRLPERHRPGHHRQARRRGRESRADQGHEGHLCKDHDAHQLCRS